MQYYAILNKELEHLEIFVSTNEDDCILLSGLSFKVAISPA
jgi:hypothetical protein